MATTIEKKGLVEVGSGNVFADLGLPDAGEHKLRVRLALEVNTIIKQKKMKQAAVAERFGIAQPHVSELANYKLVRFTSERLMHFLTCLDQDVEIVVRPARAARAAVSLVHALA
jgi:predicted XRE-type DNA-binding protein